MWTLLSFTLASRVKEVFSTCPPPREGRGWFEMDLIIDGRRSKMLEDERRVNLIEIYSNNIAWQHKIIFSQWDFAELLIDGNASIVQ